MLACELTLKRSVRYTNKCTPIQFCRLRHTAKPKDLYRNDGERTVHTLRVTKGQNANTLTESTFRFVSPKTKRIRAKDYKLPEVLEVPGIDKTLVTKEDKRVTGIIPGKYGEQPYLDMAKKLADDSGLRFFKNEEDCKNSGCLFALVTAPDLCLTFLGNPDIVEHQQMALTHDLTKLYNDRLGSFSKKSPFLRALQVKDKKLANLHVLDGTGGLGIDAFTIAMFGTKVDVLERNPVMYILQRFAHERCKEHPDLVQTIGRMSVTHADAVPYIRSLQKKPDIIYLDPMYPSRPRRKGEPRKTMTIASLLTTYGRDEDEVDLDKDTATLLKTAREVTSVVLKRPKHAKTNVLTQRSHAERVTRWDVFGPIVPGVDENAIIAEKLTQRRKTKDEEKERKRQNRQPAVKATKSAYA